MNEKTKVPTLAIIEITDNILSVDPPFISPALSHSLQILAFFDFKVPSQWTRPTPPHPTPLSSLDLVALEPDHLANQTHCFSIMSLFLHFTAARYFRIYPSKKDPKVDLTCKIGNTTPEVHQLNLILYYSTQYLTLINSPRLLLSNFTLDP